VKRTTRITLLLFLLLLLIIVCIWCHADKIVEKRALIALEIPLKSTDVKKTFPSNELINNENVMPSVPSTKPPLVTTEDSMIIKDENLSGSEPIFYTIRKENNRLTLEGTLSSVEEEKLLISAIQSPKLVKTTTINPKLLGNDEAFSLTLKLLKIFKSEYTEGFISYEEHLFTVGGIVATEASKSKMNRLLQTHSNDFNNYTKVKLSEEDLKAQKEALISKNRQKREQEAKEELENNKRIDEALQLEKEKEAKVFEARIKAILDSEKIRFESSKSILATKSKQTIGKIAKLLQEHSDVNIEISGHTDSSGDAKRNLQLSQNRVNAVKKLLMEHHIDASRLSAIGYGSTQPLVSNDTKENRQINRRVEFKIIGE